MLLTQQIGKMGNNKTDQTLPLKMVFIFWSGFACALLFILIALKVNTL